jgi:hypothetical protein
MLRIGNKNHENTNFGRLEMKLERESQEIRETSNTKRT